MTLNSTLTVFFYCAHVKIFHYSAFGVLSAIDILACFLQSPAPHTRLLTRLVICCLLPILEDCHKTLLKMTDEESQLLLTYVSETNFPGGLDRAKFLMANSILYGDVCPQNALGPLAVKVAETVVQQIFNLHDNCVLESALCLLWTLCHTPGIVQRLSQIDHLIPELKTMQQTRCLAVSSLAKAVLWKLGCGNHEGILLAFVAFLKWNKHISYIFVHLDCNILFWYILLSEKCVAKFQTPSSLC